MEYTILWERYLGDLERNVNVKIEKGWRPIGGIAVEGSGMDAYYIQAMLKGEE